MTSKYCGTVEFDPTGEGDGKVLVWDADAEMFVFTRVLSNIDDTNRADGKILVYRSASGKLEYENR